MKAYIIGSSPSGKVDIDCSQHETYGLNGAAIKHKTKFAFTGHCEPWIPAYIQNNIKNIIVVDPMFEGEDISTIEHIDSIKQNVPQSVFDMIEQSNMVISDVIESAINKEDISYPNYWTVLHLAIFYLIKNGFKEIDLIACHNDYEKYEHCPYDAEKAPYMRIHTQKIVRIADAYGIIINWIK